jgi:uncharacterized protein
MSTTELQPWYREPWPWLLIAGPLIVVIASGITFWLAFSGRDPLVVDDYYKVGKAINMTLRRDAHARDLGLSAQVSLNAERVTAVLQSTADLPLPPVLNLLVTHATQREKDHAVLLSATGPGRYTGSIVHVDPGRYHLTLEDSVRSWRLTRDWSANGHPAVLAIEPTSELN